MDVGTIVARAARRYHDRIAVEDDTRSLTFGELGDRVRRLAAGLLSLGLKPGDRVLDLQTNAVSYVETDLAFATAGLVRVALNHRLLPEDWTRIAGDCEARAIVYREEFHGKVGSLADSLDHAVVIGGDYESLIARTEPLPRKLGFDPGTLVSLNYSSGTTGKPKGARRTHRNRVASMANMMADVLGAQRPDDAWVHAGPITHASGLFVLPHVALGVRQIILPSFSPEALVDAVAARGGTGTVLVPTMLARTVAHDGMGPEVLSNLRRLCYAGAPTPPDQIRRAAEVLTPNLVQFYGLVESIPPVSVLSTADHALGLSSRPELLTSAGRACLGVELAVVDDAGVPIADGELGEVVTRGDHVMEGYFGAAAAEGATKSVVDGWLRTGDIGRLDAEGYLYLADRRGDMIITGGYNVYPSEVENVLASLPGIGEVAVVGVADEEWGQRIVAVYSSATPLDEAALLEACRERLPGYKKPKEFRRVRAFPLSSTGKIAKNVLRKRLEAGEEPGETA